MKNNIKNLNPNNIKPIPRYIEAAIKQRDIQWYPAQKGATRLHSYLTTIKGELVKVTVAVKTYKKVWYCKQVAVHGLKSENCFIKDMEYVHFGMGYRFGWYAEGFYKRKKWFEGSWRSAECKYYNPYTIPINPEFIEKFPEYKYSGYRHFMGKCLIEFLKLYQKYPQVEYLVKLGLHSIHDSVMILKRIAKDKKFCRWLIAKKDEILTTHCYVTAILQAYKTGKPIKQAQVFYERKKRLERDSSLSPIKELFKGQNLEQFFLYIDKQNISASRYRDYLTACNYLELDMAENKNRFPHNFTHWHDVRIDQYHAKKAQADAAQRAELYAQFAAVAVKYTALQKTGKCGYAIVIAKSPAELLHEGEQLNHCVGKMNYDGKFVREETLIFFVRNMSNPDTPFCTIEYSPASKKILQCYGQKHTIPDESVNHFIHKIWLPHAKKTTNKINKINKEQAA